MSLYWKKFTYHGAIAGMITGGLVVILWIAFSGFGTNLYELIPGFILGLVACICVSLLDKANAEKGKEAFYAALAFSEEQEQNYDDVQAL